MADLTDARILELATENGQSLGLHYPPVLTDIGNGKMKFITPSERTYHAEKLISFARLVEKEVSDG